MTNRHVNGIDSDTGTEDDNDSEDEEYEDGEEEEDSEVDSVEVVAEPEDSPKLKAAKQKIKPLCETTWVERHTAFQDFEDMY